MANSINIPKTHLIMALCLPLAVLMGYFLAEPMDSANLAVVVLVLFVLAVPLLMKWHHPMLIMSWNALLAPVFLPGQPFGWMIMAFASLIFAVLNRAVQQERPFISVPSVTTSLLFLAGVVLVTAMVNGGIGLRSLGAARYGSRNYFYLLAAVGGYFAFTSQRIEPEKAGLYMAMFFLPAFTGLIPNIVYALGPSGYFLFNFFPVGGVAEQAQSESRLGLSIIRITGLSVASPGLYAFVLARYGIRGSLDLTKPWRVCLLVLAVLGCAASGFRAVLIMFILTFAALFYFEGLHRTRLLVVFLGLGLFSAAVVLPFVDKMPMVVQRTLSFLPTKVDPIVAQSAEASTDWRLQLWREVVPEIPKYLIKGKGYSLDPTDVYLTDEAVKRTGRDSQRSSILAGDYHNGPLSVIIPFGIFGVAGFIWFLSSSVRVLYRNHKFGDARLKSANSLLLAIFVAKIIFFTFVFGAFYADMAFFIGVIGLSASLNGAPAEVKAEEVLEEPVEAFS